MKFIGEHLLPGQIGHFFVILGFVASLFATICFFQASKRTLNPIDQKNWLRFARGAFLVQIFSVITIFAIIYFICANHYYEYLYAYKHASKELESKYLLACIWEGQEGSFLLWTMWHSILGIVIMIKSKEWEAPVMTVISFAQFFLLMMILGIYFFDVRIGSSPFVLTRNEINAPIFSQPDYLSFIKDGVGLNVLLRNYWMVIHPPVLFLGFASSIIPFAYAYAGLQTKRYGDWIKPALPYTLFCACILGVGIMMGGKWAYESLSFGGYWAWDPVENASLVPWLILIAGLHTMVIYKATGNSLRISYLFALLTFAFVLYSTFLTRTGILGDTSVHAFTEAGKAMNIMILLFVLAFTLPALVLFFKNIRKIPGDVKEEKTNSREFWIFIGALVFFLSALFIIVKTSLPVFNKIFGTKLAPPEDAEFSYNKVMVLVAIIVGILTAVSQYLKYKNTTSGYIVKKIALPTLISIALTISIHFLYPMEYYKQGLGFLIAIDTALFASMYAVIANTGYIWLGLKGNIKSAGASFSHIGFALMIVGILISSSNKQVISSSKVNGINLPPATDPMTKMQDNPLENLTLIRQLPTRLGAYEVTYTKDSTGHEKGRKFYQLLFEKKGTSNQKVTEQFVLTPDVYQMKDNNMSSNPDIKTYLFKDIFTYISYAINEEKNIDTAQFTIKEMAKGDTVFYSKGYLILTDIIRNPHNDRYNFTSNDKAMMADISIVSKDSMHYKAMPVILVDEFGIKNIDDTVYAQNLYIKFAGVSSDMKKVKIGVKESEKIIDYVAVKAYIFPFINLVWAGLIIMALGFVMSLTKRLQLSTAPSIAALILTAISLFYMFLLAN